MLPLSKSTLRQIAVQFLPVIREQVVPFIKGKLIPAFKDFAGRIKGVIDWFVNLSPEMKSMILTVTALVAVVMAARCSLLDSRR